MTQVPAGGKHSPCRLLGTPPAVTTAFMSPLACGCQRGIVPGAQGTAPNALPCKLQITEHAVGHAADFWNNSIAFCSNPFWSR